MLRRRAQWYRDFADVGSADNKALRLSLAQYFDRMADEAAKSEAANPPDAPPAAQHEPPH
ncbi:MAG: hypothetical protein ACLQUZ_13925 [Rhizomicrobium sp.]